MKIITTADVIVPSTRKYEFVGTCRLPSGEVKVRFGNDVQQRLKVMAQQNFTEAKFVQLDEPLDRVAAVQTIVGLPEFAGMEEQAALLGFLAKNGITQVVAEEPAAEEAAATEVTAEEPAQEEVTA